MIERHIHQPEILAYLQTHFRTADWELTLPNGRGSETYFAHSHDRAFFIKLGVHLPRYLAMADLGFTPEVMTAGQLEDGTAFIIQPFVPGRFPSRKDYRAYLEKFAEVIHKTHHSPLVKQALPQASSDQFSTVGLEVLADIRSRWEAHRALVPEAAQFVDESLDSLAQQVRSFQGSGLVAAHNDICNGNWLVTSEGRLYLIDLEAMALGDPALDIGATLWWYYPPELRGKFLEILGYAEDEAFQFRMRVRMAMHCLHILLPRVNSFDQFTPGAFQEALTDFRAAFAGEKNPQLYEE